MNPASKVLTQNHGIYSVIEFTKPSLLCQENIFLPVRKLQLMESCLHRTTQMTRTMTITSTAMTVVQTAGMTSLSTVGAMLSFEVGTTGVVAVVVMTTVPG